MKKTLALGLAVAMSATALAGCTPKETEKKPAEGKVLKVAALESAYGKGGWEAVVAAFKAKHPDVDIQLTIDKNIEDVISPQMKSGNYPDVVSIAVGRPAALTETMIKDNAIRDLTAVFDMKVPGEDTVVKDKIIPGFLDTTITNPYSDNKTYLAPTFYGPCGLFYDSNLLKKNGWEVPTTWDEMWALGDKAKAKGISLFTYPTSGYFDAFIFSLLNEIGGPDFFKRAMKYEKGIWDTAEAKQVFDIVAKLATYTEKTTVANANKENYLKNQQLVLDGKAIFIPNGTWLPGEMKDAPRKEGFTWGFTALPAVKTGGDRYSYTYFEQVWSPKESKNQDLANQFIAYLYSDEATKLFIEKSTAPAVQPIKNVSANLTGDNKLFYSIYDTGAKAAMGSFAATNPVEGIDMASALFGTVDSIMNGSKTVADWKKEVNKANDALRAALK